MKNKTVAVAGVTLGVVLTVYAVLGFGLLKEQQDQNEVSAQIEQLRPLADLPDPDFDELTMQLQDAQQTLAAEEAFLPESVHSADVIQAVVQLAAETQIRIYPLGADPLALETIGGQQYPMLKINAAAEGALTDLQTFIAKLEDGRVKALRVDEVSLTQNGSIWSGSLSLLVYAQPLPQPTPDPAEETVDE